MAMVKGRHKDFWRLSHLSVLTNSLTVLQGCTMKGALYRQVYFIAMHGCMSFPPLHISTWFTYHLEQTLTMHKFIEKEMVIKLSGIIFDEGDQKLRDNSWERTGCIVSRRERTGCIVERELAA